MAAVANFTSDLIVKKLPGKFWEVMEAFTYHLGAPDGLEFVAVPIGTITDFASIPPPASWIWKSPGSNIDKPAVIHDLLYAEPYIHHIHGTFRRIDRAEADAIFHEALGVEELKIRATTRWALYKGVRVGGGRAWNRYRASETSDVYDD